MIAESIVVQNFGLDLSDVRGLAGLADEAIANKIIEIAKTGERNPDLLCEHALKEIRQPEV
jgi:hypothetical protein